ncbi:thioredoxin family protein [Roseivirga sp. E12]|uniref:thioredoxin family protein n=1 Tax=Roseivirga sp. E12 TaxID=2819237 RepID=UPI001ABC5C81|nr:thioredoxin family protein [Roseivirga sp. E12]MBO3697184.1 thioredoxin family protein [Roseivirga sp. E12]
MKNLLLILSFTLLPFNDSVDWTFDFEEAKAQAATSQKTILVVFSGSDWCKPCIQLHKELFESDKFIVYAKENLVLVKADFPYRKKNKLSKEQTLHNEALAAKYNPNGEFPLAVFTDASGKALGTFGFDKTKTPQDYILQFNQFLK